MFKTSKIGLILIISIFMSCKKKEESTTVNSNIASQVVTNLSQVSSNFTPTSLSSASSQNLSQASDPCASTTDWAICQSNLIREYLKIGKSSVETITQLVSSIGGALGQIPDGNSGTSENGKISWSKSNSGAWSVISRGTNNASNAYISISSNVYTLKVDNSVSENSPTNWKVEASVTYTDSETWDVTVFVSNTDCNSSDVGAPSKATIYVSKANGLWSGKAMLYSPRWKKPNVTVTCNGTAAGTYEIAMYTDFVGNNTSTKAALYLIPASVSSLTNSNSSTYSINNFCTNFSDACGVTGGPTSSYFTTNGIQNNWCTTGANTSPTWGNNCSSNASVSSASYSSDSIWIAPATLKLKDVTLPTSL